MTKGALMGIEGRPGRAPADLGKGFDPRVVPLRHRVFLWLFLVLSLLASVLLWRREDGEVAAQNRLRFDDQAAQLEAVVRGRLAVYEGVLRAARGLLQHAPTITSDEWHRFVESLEMDSNYPGIDGITFTAYVPGFDRDGFEERMRARDGTDFTITPAGARDDYFVVSLIEPERAAKARGFDIGSEPIRRHAAEKARDNGLPVFSDAVSLITPGGTERDFLHMLPVYGDGPTDSLEQRRTKLRGWVTAGYNMRRLAQRAFQASTPDVRLQIFDGAELNTANLLYDSAETNAEAAKPSRSPLTKIVPMDIGAHPWTLRFSTTAPFDGAGPNVAPMAMLLVSLALSLALWAAARLLVTGRAGAMALAETMTGTLRESEERYRQLFTGAKDMQLLVDPTDGRIVDANPAAAAYYGYPVALLKTLDIAALTVPEHPTRHRLHSGEARDVEMHVGRVTIAGRPLDYAVIQDVTDRLRGEQLLEVIRRGQQDFIANAGETSDLFQRLLSDVVNLTDSVCGFMGEVLTGADGTANLQIHAIICRGGDDCFGGNGTTESLWPLFHPVLETRAPIIANRAKTPGAEAALFAWTGLRAYCGLPLFNGTTMVGIIGLANREGGYPSGFARHLEPFTLGLGTMLGALVNERRRHEAESKLEQAVVELERSNAELEQFAYVASHDLQEPVRMIHSFLQLLERRNGDKLDRESHEYIDFALDGAGRMHLLIKDLLEYSRVGRMGRPKAPLPAQVVIDIALAMLRMAIAECEADVQCDDITAVVVGERGELARVFQNLIGNALKYRAPNRTPQVRIAARRNDNDWVFSVRDNGIGIPPEQFDRVFRIFQRLHTRQEYSGTGIGLAITKKIIERHGGRIWIESTPGQGSGFYFTLPVPRDTAAQVISPPPPVA